MEIDDRESLMQVGGGRRDEIRTRIRDAVQPPFRPRGQARAGGPAKNRPADRQPRGGQPRNDDGSPRRGHQALRSANGSAWAEVRASASSAASRSSIGSPVYAAAWSVKSWA